MAALTTKPLAEATEERVWSNGGGGVEVCAKNEKREDEGGSLDICTKNSGGRTIEKKERLWDGA